MRFKLGKLPKPEDKRDLLFRDFVVKKQLPKPPKAFGHEALVQSWGVLGNDDWGDCVFAGAAHETMLWNREAGLTVPFSDVAVLSDYSAVTGFHFTDDSDQGTVVRDALKYRQKTGVRDARGQRHRIGAYVALEPGNVTELRQAMYLFGAVGIGFEFPAAAWDQFDRGQLWRISGDQSIEGGHYVPMVAHRRYDVCVTWGRLQTMSAAFYQRHVDEAWAILSPEMLKDGRSLEGFSLPDLQAALQSI